jgi:predicted nucleic acid-binding protein
MVALVFDSSALSCFARASRLPLLDDLSAGFDRVTTRAVMGELEQGSSIHPQLADVADLSWLRIVPLDTLAELRLFAEYSRRLAAGARNVGEASVLAWAEAHDAIAIVDDQAAVQCGKARGVQVKRSLAFVAEGVATGVLSREEAGAVVDELARGGARFPCSGADFLAWASEKGLLAPGSGD